MISVPRSMRTLLGFGRVGASGRSWTPALSLVPAPPA